jgi:hypothetical protein
VKNGRGTRQNKHLHKRYNYIREQYIAKVIKVEHIPGNDNPADTLTKPLSAVPYLKHRRKMNMRYLRVLLGEANEDQLDRVGEAKVSRKDKRALYMHSRFGFKV